MAVAVALNQCICAQQITDLMTTDPRLAAAYHFAEFAGGYKNIKVDLLAHRVTFTTSAGGRKEWNCEGTFFWKEGPQQSRCYLRQPNTAMALVYESTVVTTNGSIAVSLQSSEDGLRYGNGLAGESLLPKWLPEVQRGTTLESIRALYSGGYETVDVVLRTPGSCIGYYAKILGGDIVGAGNELRWSGSQNGSTIIVSAMAAGQLCKLTGKKVPGRPQAHKKDPN